MVELIDTGGMVCGFRLQTDAPAQAVQWNLGQMEPGRIPEHPRQLLWLHFNLADQRADRWIEACSHIPEEAREVLLNDDAHIHMLPLQESLVGVLGDLHHDFENDPDGLGVLRLFIGETLVVSGRHHPLKSFDRLRVDLRKGEPIGTPVHWMAHLVHQLSESFGAAVTALNEEVDSAEDRILQGRIRDEAKSLGSVRRLLARLRRHLGANRHALIHARTRLPGWCPETDAVQLRLSLDRLDAIAQDLELVQERARLLQEEIAGAISEATNRNLYLLSIVTTVLMPISIITGVFGMNVGGLPGLQDPGGFWWVFMLMLVTGLATVLLLRWRKLF